MKAVAIRQTAMIAMTKIGRSKPESWNVKKTSISVTRNGMRRNSSTNAMPISFAGQIQAISARLSAAMMKPARNPTMQPAADSTKVPSTALARNSRL